MKISAAAGAGVIALVLTVAGCGLPSGPAPAALVITVDTPSSPVTCAHPGGADSACSWSPVEATITNLGDVPTDGPVVVTNTANGIATVDGSCSASQPLGARATCTVNYGHSYYTGSSGSISTYRFFGTVGASDDTIAAPSVSYDSDAP